ncbi:MAG: hypothetical protein QUV02_12395 [Maricaulis sp.]|uniref:hypothetical protein n=1 Tax=Maricaulis sp. TaxID=1486257 RepID=UPI001B0792CB|nr:hypothetical protein [Maricaulis sp.]MBO6847227.1 hypothetical protein [Maricaulis sp.]MBO6876885.1 hypothetical protein [Maricaulis sp.]MDM7985240.1 hypothetical protein [Maricaulis sp.]
MPHKLRALITFAYAVTFALAVYLLAVPTAAASMGLPEQSGAAIAFLFALNALAIGLGSFAIRFKFSEKYWPGYAVGAGTIFVALVAAIDGGLIWQVFINQRMDRWILFCSLAVPALAQFWLLYILTQRAVTKPSSDGLVEAAFEPDELAPVQDTAPPFWHRAAVYLATLARLMIVAILTVQIVAIAAWVAFAFYEVMRLILIEDRSISPPAMGRMIEALGQYIANLYANQAWPLARITATYVGLFLALMTIILLPLGVALSKGERALKARRLSLDDHQKTWVQSSGQTMIEWLEAQPKKALDSLMMMPVFATSCMVGPFASAALSFAVSRQINSWIAPPSSTELLRDVPGGIGVGITGVVAFGAFILLGIAGSQILPGIRGYWLSLQRKRLELQPAVVLLEVLTALESAVRNNWFPSGPVFDPSKFHHRWIMRSVNATRTFALWASPVIFLGIAIDATWYRSWGEDRVTHSPIWTLGSTDYVYSNAVEIRTECSVRESDDRPTTRLNYELIFEGGQTFSLRSSLRPTNLEVISSIDAAARSGGAEIIVDERSNLEECTALLRGRWGDDGAALAAILSPSS